jgi:hypothetical protein
MTLFLDENSPISTDETVEQTRESWRLYKKTGTDTRLHFSKCLRGNGFEARECRSTL